MLRLILLVAALAAASAAPAVSAESYGAELEGFDYPYPVERHPVRSQGQDLQMAYMDVRPERPNGRTAVLLHGKNFCAATWERTIAVLSEAGFRVIAPDQVGFCKSSKPVGYQFTFEALAANTVGLLDRLGIGRAVVIGHSMGGMLGARLALMRPDRVERLVLVDPLGLEDWRAEGVPWQSLDAAYAAERRTDAASIKNYQLRFYYNGVWRPDYNRWVAMAAGLSAGPGAERVSWNAAQTSEMIYTQPVLYELPRLAMPVTLMVGGRDRTAPGAARAAPDVQARLGRYDRLGPAVAARIPGATLVTFDDLGHAPQVEAPDRFHAALLPALSPP